MRWSIFFKGVIKDARIFGFFLLLISILRLLFILIYHHELVEPLDFREVMAVLYFGSAISFKELVFITFVSFLFCTIPSTVMKTAKLANIRLALAAMGIFLYTFLFQLRIAYYKEFHTSFDYVIFNLFKDDFFALCRTLVQQYNLVPKIGLLFLTAVLLIWIMKKWLDRPTIAWPLYNKPYDRMARCLLVIACFSFFVFYNVGEKIINYKHNYAITSSKILNEAVVDDVASLKLAYFAYWHNNVKGMNVDATKLKNYTAVMSSTHQASNTVDETFVKHAQGAKIPKPKHIFLVICESYGARPLADKYSNLNLTNGLKEIINQKDAAVVNKFLPAGQVTVHALNTIVTGLPEINLFPNFEAETYKNSYITSIAPQMKKLGYQTYFWYGGFSSWQRIEDFTRAQGFDHFYGFTKTNDHRGNMWGDDDKYLFETITNNFAGDESNFHVILTMSNHPPYTINLEDEGFDLNALRAAIPDTVKIDEQGLRALGHLWYSDKYLTSFINSMRQKYPDSLFIITGDHTFRIFHDIFTDNNISPLERDGVPFVVYGQGITKQVFPADAVGSHLNIAPTLIELIAPKGFTYYSTSDSLTNQNDLGLNSRLWMTSHFIGHVDPFDFQSITIDDGTIPEQDEAVLKQRIEAIRALAWWRIKKGSAL